MLTQKFLQADDVRKFKHLGVLTTNDAGRMIESGEWIDCCRHDGRSKKGSEDDFGCHGDC